MSDRDFFFIVGAPKSGTTAMTGYLAAHPEVSMCSWKEVHYFAPDLFPQRSLTEEQYLGLFPDVPGAKRWGEASVWYLYSTRAAEAIQAFAPEASIVIMVRNPVDMLYSLHAEFSFSTKERLDFEAALALDPEREAGTAERRFVPRSYRSAAMYHDQIERYLRVFGRERVHVILFDDFARDVAGEYERTCRFLDVDPEFAPDFDVVNASKKNRSQALGNFLRRPPPALRSMVRAVMPRPVRARLFKSAVKANRAFEPRPPMRPEFRRQLALEFSGEVERLEQLIGRDLSAWKPAELRVPTVNAP